MKRYFLLTVTLAIISQMQAGYPQGYYTSLEGKNQAALKSAVCSVIRQHTNISYGDNTWNAFKKTDVKVVDGKEYWWDMYSSNLVLISSGHGSLNIEHSVANSWWDGTKNDAYNDIHHLNPSDATANNRKSNYPLGKVGTVTWTNGVTTVGKPASGDYGGASYVYEPCDEYKGDFARVFMYMFTCYEDMAWGNRFTWMYNEGEKYPMFRPWAVTMLLDWSRNDPVSDKERNRNDAVYSVQHNRNPFIDLPHLSEYIWGNKKNLPFSISGEEPGDAELTQPVGGTRYDLGSRPVGASTSVAIPLKGVNIYSPVTISISGDTQFTLSATQCSAAEVMAGTTVTVSYMPQHTGIAQATVSFSGGGLESPVAVTVAAEATERQPLPPVTALMPKPLQPASYRALWTVPETTPDYYIVNRTYEIDGQTKTRRYMTSVPYYDFNDRNFDKDESYTVQYAVGSDVSQPSNVIEVKAGTVAADMTGEDAFEVSCIPGGVMIECGVNIPLTITDVSGRVMTSVRNASVREFVPLARGIYILTSPKAGKPLKIYVP